MFFGLRDYQYEGAEFLGENPKVGLFFDCGMGKTLTVLSALSHYRAQMLPALVIAPKRVAHTVWRQEIEKWGFQLSHALGHGRHRDRNLNSEHFDVTIATPQSIEHVKSPRWRTVIVDESTYFKNGESKRWARAAKICAAAERVVLLTGTPIAGRGHLDLWGQFALLGDANPFGSWWTFTAQHFAFDIFNRPNLLSGHAEILNEMIAPLVLRKSVDEIEMPELVEIDELVEMPAAARKRYAEIQLDENSYAPLRTMASGFEYDKHWSGEVNPKWHHQAKLDALTDLRAATLGENLLVFANFREEIAAICSKFKCPSVDGSTASANATEHIDDWNAGRLPMLVLHPRSGGHGLNLQSGGRRVVWFSLPDSGETWTQANARLYRSGQAAGTVFVHKLIREETIDVAIRDLIAKKCLNEQTLLDAVR